MEGDYRIPTALGSVAWAAAGVVLLLRGLPPEDQWWLWVCVTGFALGLFGFFYVPRLQRRRARADAAPSPETD